MLEPGGKNWIRKYFQMVDNGVITLSSDTFQHTKTDDFLHASQFQTGISFGYAVGFIFCKSIDKTSWTDAEKLKVLLFESLLNVYLNTPGTNKQDYSGFLSSLTFFYEGYKEQSITSIFNFLKKEDNSSIIESILTKRVVIKKTYKNVFWVNYLGNSLIYLDVIAYKQFLQNGETMVVSHEELAKVALKTIGLASYSDGVIESQEKIIMDIFFSSATISSKDKKSITQEIMQPSTNLEDVLSLPFQNRLLNLYLLDLAVLIVYADSHAHDTEIQFLIKLCQILKIPKKSLDTTLVLIERFILENNHKISFLREANTYDRIYGNFSKHWIKILGRNKSKLVNELKQNKELIALVNKSLVKELSQEEKDKVKTQFTDLIKSMPALAIFMLPGGALLLPIILKIIPDLIPSSFQKNKLD